MTEKHFGIAFSRFISAVFKPTIHVGVPQRLTNGQALLSDLFHQDLSENDLHEVRNLLAKHFSKKARTETQKYVLELPITAQD